MLNINLVENNEERWALSESTVYSVPFREIVIVENIRLVHQLDLTGDFGVKTNTKLTPNCQLKEKSKLVFRAVCTLYTVTLTPIFA